MKNLQLFLIILLFINCESIDNRDNNSSPSTKEIKEVIPLSKAPELPKVIFTELSQITEAKKSTVIIDELIKYVNATPKEESIYISIYLFEYAPLIQALKDAHSRGVEIYLTIDNSDRSNNQTTITELGALGENMEIIPVKNDASSIAINHNKFVLFSKIETEDQDLDQVVFQTSQNFTSSGTKKIQDALIFSNPELYNNYLDYWERIKALSTHSMSEFSYSEFTDDSEDIMLQFYPKRKNGERFGEDSIIEILNKITDPEHSSITIGMSDWADSRVIIFDKLHELLLQGAEIEIITKTGKGPEVMKMLKKLQTNGAFIKVYNMSNASEVPVINIHTKILMIDGEYENKAQQILITGTQNFTNNAIWNNNEVSLILKNNNLFNVYREYFQELKALPGIDLNQ